MQIKIPPFSFFEQEITQCKHLRKKYIQTFIKISFYTD